MAKDSPAGAAAGLSEKDEEMREKRLVHGQTIYENNKYSLRLVQKGESQVTCVLGQLVQLDIPCLGQHSFYPHTKSILSNHLPA